MKNLIHSSAILIFLSKFSAGPTASDANKAIDASINTLTPGTKQFIVDLCTFLTNIKEKLDSISIKGRHFLYNWLTISKQDKFQTISDLFAYFKRVVKKVVGKNDAYFIYDYMSSQFGTLIDYKNGRFFMAKM